MRRVCLVLAAFCCVALLGVTDVRAADKPAKIKALIITGDDVSVHKWREMAEATRKALVDSGRFEVKISEDPLILESAKALANYDVILFTIYTTSQTPPITPLAQKNLLNYVKGGKGFFIQHLASASYPKWEEWGKLCGRKWIMGTSGHGPRSVFESKIVDKERPSPRAWKILRPTMSCIPSCRATRRFTSSSRPIPTGARKRNRWSSSWNTARAALFTIATATMAKPCRHPRS